MKKIFILTVCLLFITSCSRKNDVNLENDNKIHKLELKENHICLSINRSTANAVFITTLDTLTNIEYNYLYGQFYRETIFEY